MTQAKRRLQATWTQTFPGLWWKRLILPQHLERRGPQKKLLPLPLEAEGRPPSWHQMLSPRLGLRAGPKRSPVHRKPPCRRSRRTEEPQENVSRELSPFLLPLYPLLLPLYLPCARMCVLGIGVELPSAHCAPRLATCAPLPPSQCRGIHLWSADLVSVWTEGAVPCITPRTANVFEGRLGACVR